MPSRKDTQPVRGRATTRPNGSAGLRASPAASASISPRLSTARLAMRVTNPETASSKPARYLGRHRMTSRMAPLSYRAWHASHQGGHVSSPSPTRGWRAHVHESHRRTPTHKKARTRPA
jgi:hypothetical protein